jgi:hypothetical protein
MNISKHHQLEFFEQEYIAHSVHEIIHLDFSAS